MQEKMRRAQRLYDAFQRYKETAQQYEFFCIARLDSVINPAYADLQANYTDEHADIFINGLSKLCKSWHISVDEDKEGDDGP